MISPNLHTWTHTGRARGVSSANPFVTFREALHLFWSVADGYTQMRLLLALTAVAGGALIAALTPIALKLVVDSLAAQNGGTALLTPIGFVLFYAAGQYICRCMSDVRIMLHGHAEQRVRRRLGGRLFEHLVRMPLRFHLERKTGAVGQTLEEGLRGYDILIQQLVYAVVPVAVEFAAVAFVLLQLEKVQYLAVLGAAALAYVFAFHRWAVRVHGPSQHASTLHIEAHAALADALGSHETIKYFNAEAAVCERYDLALSRTEAAWTRFYREHGINGLIVATIFGLSLAMVLTLGALDVERGAITVGDFVLVNAYVVRLVQPIEMLGFAVRDITRALAFLSNMLALFREKTERDSPGSSMVSGGRGELVFDHVTFSYSQDRTVLRDVSFRVPPGKTLAIVGVSGSGKSSLIRLLFRLYEPDSGQIRLDGVALADMSLSAIRQIIGIIPQDTVLLHDTIAHNIALGKYGATYGDVEAAAKIAHLHDFIACLPEGYGTVVGERGLKLSGGERQRVAIARAALRRPRILVCDEATSSLDTRSERAIMHNLIELSSQSTTLVIAHRLSTVVHADEILVLNHGAIVERGTHDELRVRGGYYAGMWDAQQSGAKVADE